MVDANFVLNLVETVGILIGVTIGIIEIRNIREERKNQLIDQTLQNYNKIETSEVWIKSIVQRFSSYEEWAEKYGPYTNPEAAKYMYAMWNYYNVVGTHIRDGLIDADYWLRMRIWPITVIAIWEKCKVIFEEWREFYNDPSMYEGFEYLYNVIKQRYPHVTYTPSPLPKQAPT
jgi:hypothetical protein